MILVVFSGLLFLLGTAVGSFVNVVVGRSVSGEQWQTGRSHCDYCQHQLEWYELIPLLSYLLQRGKTACCDQPLSIGHPVVELLFGSLFVWWCWFGSLFFQLTQAPLSVVQPIFWLTVGIILLWIAIADLKSLTIPSSALYLLIGISLLYRIGLVSLGAMRLVDMSYASMATFGVWLFFYGLWRLTQKRGLGEGDVWLVIPLSMLLGWPKILVGLFVAFVVGAGAGLVLMLTQRAGWKTKVPFGPFLIFGTAVGLIWGAAILNWYLGLLL